MAGKTKEKSSVVRVDAPKGPGQVIYPNSPDFSPNFSGLKVRLPSISLSIEEIRNRREILIFVCYYLIRGLLRFRGSRFSNFI